MEGQLKPCPFCGGHALIEEQSLVFSLYRYTVYCPHCYGREGKVLKRGYDLKDAVKKWNRRA